MDWRTLRKLLSWLGLENHGKSMEILRKLLSWLSHGRGKAWYSICTTSKPAHSYEILYDKCFFEYITTTFVTF